MSDERIDIVIEDKVSSGIAAKIDGIAASSRSAFTAVERLKNQLEMLNTGALRQLQTALGMAVTSMNQTVLANQRLLTEVQRTAQATANAAAAQVRATTASTQGATAQQQLAAATSKTTQAATAAQTAAQQLATAQQRTAAATAQAATANSNAALAALKLQQAQNKVAQSAQSANQQVLGFVKTALQLAAIEISARSIGDAIDEYTMLENKLRSVGVAQQDLNFVMGKAIEASISSRSDLEQTVTTYQRLSIATHDLGLSQHEVMDITTTLSKAIQMSGATAQAAKAGLYQLAEGMEANRLQGIHLKALITDLPMLAKQLATAMGTNIDGLRKMGTKGTLTAEVIVKAIQKIKGEVNNGFGNSVETLSQSFTNLKTRFVEFIGQLNQATGAGKAITGFIDFMANNLSAIAIGFTVIGAALLVAFGPALVAMLTAATSAVVAFTLAIATNPIGLMIVGISTAIAAIALFGDQIAVSSDGLVTFKDTALAVWSFIKDGFSAVASFIGVVWNLTIDSLNSKTNGWGETFRNIGGFLLQVAKATANGIIAYYVGAFNAIVAGWRLLPAAMRDIIAMAVNLLIEGNEKMINAALNGVNKLTKLANQSAEKLGIGKIFDEDLSLSLDKYKMQVGSAASDLGGVVKKSFSDAFNTDFVGTAVAAVSKRAREISEARRKLSTPSGAYDVTGKNTTTPAIDEKAIEKRALAMAKVNAELDKQIRGFNVLKPQRDIQAALDQIEIGLASKKIKLSTEEESAIRSKITAIENAKATQAAFDQIYEASIGPQRDFNAQIAAASQLLNMGAISTERYQRTIVMASETYKAAIDPLYLINRELEQQSQLLALVGPEQEIAQQMQQLKNELLAKGIVLSQGELVVMQSKFSALQQEKLINQELNKIYGETQGKQLSLETQAIALNQAFSKGILTLDQYSNRLVKLGIEAANVKLQMGDASFADMATASLGTLVAQYENVGKSLSDSFGQFFQSFTDGFANSVGRAVVYSENLHDALTSVAKEAVAGLISALVKLGIQYVVNAALGESIGVTALATQTAASVAAASTTALAWAPAAALASLASFGANSLPAMAGIAATSALSEGMALASIAGFESGGYTGDIGTKQVAGLVHGQEFVVNAAATARNRDTLEAMNRGASGVAMNSSSVGKSSVSSGGVQVNIENYGTSKDFEVQQLSETDIRIIARDEAKGVVRKEAPGVISASISNPNSSVSKSLGKNTQTQRRR